MSDLQKSTRAHLTRVMENFCVWGQLSWLVLSPEDSGTQMYPDPDSFLTFMLLKEHLASSFHLLPPPPAQFPPFTWVGLTLEIGVEIKQHVV